MFYASKELLPVKSNHTESELFIHYLDQQMVTDCRKLIEIKHVNHRC